MLDNVYSIRSIRASFLCCNNRGVAAHDFVNALLLLKFIHQEIVILFVHFPCQLRNLLNRNICYWVILSDQQFLVKEWILMQRHSLIKFIHWELLTWCKDGSLGGRQNLTLWNLFFDAILIIKRLILLWLIISWQHMNFTHIVLRLLFIDRE